MNPMRTSYGLGIIHIIMRKINSKLWKPILENTMDDLKICNKTNFARKKADLKKYAKSYWKVPLLISIKCALSNLFL